MHLIGLFREKTTDKEKDLTQGNVAKTMLLFACPKEREFCLHICLHRSGLSVSLAFGGLSR